MKMILLGSCQSRYENEIDITGGAVTQKWETDIITCDIHITIIIGKIFIMKRHIYLCR